MSQKIGIITFHAAYNFGSVLQAYATQQSISMLGFDVSIIDYRPKSQNDYYGKLYRTSFGIKPFIKDLMMVPARSERLIRRNRFEAFIKEHLSLTEERFTFPDELNKIADTFDVFVSGSDQIINKHSNELQNENWSAMNPYLLTFTTRKKITYASSPSSMSDEELQNIVEPLKRFDFISAREEDAAVKISHLTGKKVPNVLDPTLLLSKEKWLKVSEGASIRSLPHDFVLYYSLDGTNKVAKRVTTLRNIAKSLNVPVLVITPFAYVPSDKYLINDHSFGPSEFIQAINNASLVITDSYHGTLFSLNLGTPFLSISSGSGSSTRKDQVLSRLHLSDHIVGSLEDSVSKLSKGNFSEDKDYRQLLDKLRQESVSYLSNSLKYES